MRVQVGRRIDNGVRNVIEMREQCNCIGGVCVFQKPFLGKANVWALAGSEDRVSNPGPKPKMSDVWGCSMFASGFRVRSPSGST